MAYEHKDLHGSLFKNDRKAAGSKQPDYKGSAMVLGSLIYIAGWIKEGKKGNFLSLKFSYPSAFPKEPNGSVQQQLDNDLPPAPF